MDRKKGKLFPNILGRSKKSGSEPDISKFAPVGTKYCESKCDRVVVVTKEGPVIACNYCKRIVIDNREK